MLKRLTGILSFILVSLLVLAACGRSDDSAFPAESGYTDEQLMLGAVSRFAGVVVSGEETKVEKDDSRSIAEVKVSVGDVVKKGQVLFTYDATSAQFEYEKEEIELEQMRMSLEGFNEQRKELEKEKKSAPESEQLSYTLQIQEIDTSIRETNYNIGLKEKELKKMEAGLGNLEVTSPVAGKVQAVNYSEDDSQDEYSDDEEYSGSGDSSQPFIVITQTNALRIKGTINEENIDALTEGDPVTIRSRVNDQTWEGEIAQIERENPQQSQNDYYEGDDSEMTSSSRYPFYVDLKDTEGLMLGQHVYIELAIDPALLAPAEEDMGDEEMAMDEEMEEDLEEEMEEDLEDAFSEGGAPGEVEDDVKAED